MTPRANYRIADGHIAQGQPGKCATCPAALAIAEQGEWADVLVDALYARAVAADGSRWHARLPAHMGRWVGDYDRRLPVQPASFTLRWSPC